TFQRSRSKHCRPWSHRSLDLSVGYSERTRRQKRWSVQLHYLD
ncbi:unnamed protein product, partial [Ectocarpus fasciculatus]